MYTRCPHCISFFAVSAEQLAVADGRVRCGACLSIFDGLEHLTEQPPRQKTGGSVIESRSSESDNSSGDDGSWPSRIGPGACDGETLEITLPTLTEAPWRA